MGVTVRRALLPLAVLATVARAQPQNTAFAVRLPFQRPANRRSRFAIDWLRQADRVCPPQPNGELILAGFVPSLPLGVVGLVLFALSSVALWAHWFRTNRRRYMLTLTISMVCESNFVCDSSQCPSEPHADMTRPAGMTLGFLFRLIYRSNYTSLGLYIIQYMFVLLSPCAFLAMDCESQDVLNAPRSRCVCQAFH